METKDLSWEAMQRFLKENKGLIVQTCRIYKFNPAEVVNIIEDAYIEARKTYEQERATTYAFTTHFTQYLRSSLNREATLKNRVVLLDDIRTQASDDGAGEDSGSPRKKEGGIRLKSLNEDTDSKTLVEEILSELVSACGEKKAKKVVELVQYGLIEEAEMVVQGHGEAIYTLRKVCVSSGVVVRR